MTTEDKPKETARFPKLPSFPIWYCVKTVYGADGKVNAEVMIDEETKNPIAMQLETKPMDDAFEDLLGNITYYTYHGGYDKAAEQVRMSMA